MFKLSQGEYVPCELLETQLTSSPYVSQIWIHGESTDNFIVAVVVLADVVIIAIVVHAHAFSILLQN